VRYPVLANISAVQTKLSRGLAATLPFAQILRGIRKL
jgi:phthiodiolone/phenolphthiodiolone dimycocerosates ketoreductase